MKEQGRKVIAQNRRARHDYAVIEEFDSTTVVHPGFKVSVDDTGNLMAGYDGV